MVAASARNTILTPKRRRLAFTRLGFGGAPLGNMHRALAEDDATATVAAAWDAGLRYFDTAPLYGHGLSETRIGRALAGRPRSDFLISTKVGRLLAPCAPGEEDAGIFHATPPLSVRFDYGRDAVLRSLEASLARLSLDRVDVLYVHDLGRRTLGDAYETHWDALTRGGGWRALDELRAAGTVAAIGLGTNETAACERLLADLDPDLFLLAGRYTLLEQAPLAGLLPACERRGVRIVIGGPFNSGVLARQGGTFDYARFAVPLAAAALQFAAAHPGVAAVIPGAQTAEEVAANVALLNAPIPAGFWAALKDAGMIDATAPVPTEEATAPC